MPELGTIQLTIKFYTFFVQNSGPSLNLANAMSCPRGVEVSPLNQNAASLYAFISVLPCLLVTLWAWLLPTGVRWLLLNN